MNTNIFLPARIVSSIYLPHNVKWKFRKNFRNIESIYNNNDYYSNDVGFLFLVFFLTSRLERSNVSSTMSLCVFRDKMYHDKRYATYRRSSVFGEIVLRLYFVSQVVYVNVLVNVWIGVIKLFHTFAVSASLVPVVWSGFFSTLTIGSQYIGNCNTVQKHGRRNFKFLATCYYVPKEPNQTSGIKSADTGKSVTRFKDLIVL